MASTIQKLTPELLRQQAQAAADQHIPVREANHFEPGSREWAQFNTAYTARQNALHAERLQMFRAMGAH